MQLATTKTLVDYRVIIKDSAEAMKHFLLSLGYPQRRNVCVIVADNLQSAIPTLTRRATEHSIEMGRPLIIGLFERAGYQNNSQDPTFVGSLPCMTVLPRRYTDDRYYVYELPLTMV